MCLVGHAFVGEILLIKNILVHQLHLSKLNEELGSETSDLSLNHPNFPCPFFTKIFDEKAEVVERLDTCNGTEDPSAMICLLLIRKLKTILTTATTYDSPLFFSI